MAKKFRDLENKMSADSRGRADALYESMRAGISISEASQNKAQDIKAQRSKAPDELRCFKTDLQNPPTK